MQSAIAVGVVMAAMVGCSSASPSQPAQCDPSQVQGTYLAHATTESGNCGTTADQIVIFNGGMTSGVMMGSSSAGCQFVTYSRSEGNCRADFEEQCPGTLGTSTLTGYLIVKTADGSQIAGLLSISTPTCSGTYQVTYTRQ